MKQCSRCCMQCCVLKWTQFPPFFVPFVRSTTQELRRRDLESECLSTISARIQQQKIHPSFIKGLFEIKVKF